MLSMYISSHLLGRRHTPLSAQQVAHGKAVVRRMLVTAGGGRRLSAGWRAPTMAALSS
jgi:hypothetical protein